MSFLRAGSTSLYFGSTGPGEDLDIFSLVATIFFAGPVYMNFHIHGSFGILANEGRRIFVHVSLFHLFDFCVYLFLMLNH